MRFSDTFKFRRAKNHVLVLLKLIMTSHHWGENEIHETKTDSLKFLAVPLETQRLIVKCSSRKTAKNNGSITESELTKKKLEKYR